MSQAIGWVGLEFKKKVFQGKVTVMKMIEISHRIYRLRSKKNLKMTQKAFLWVEREESPDRKREDKENRGDMTQKPGTDIIITAGASCRFRQRGQIA